MRARILAPLGIAAAGALGFALVPADATNQTVHATGTNTFTQSTITVSVGDTVTFVNDGGFHNVKFDDLPDAMPAQPEPPNDPGWQSVSRTFTKPGTYTYHCVLHQALGMTGTVIVQDASTPAPPTTTQITMPTPPGAPAPPVGPGPSAGGGATRPSVIAPPPVRASHPSLVAATAVVRGSGVVLSLRVRGGGTRLLGVVYRRPLRGASERRLGTLRITAPAGASRVTIVRTREGRRLGRGRFRLILRPGAGPARTVRFVIGS
jgi:plastocyanin